MVSKRYELLRISGRRVRANTFLENFDDFFCVIILTSSGKFQIVYESQRFRARGIPPSVTGSRFWNYVESEVYEEAEKKKYFELVSQGWKPISGAHELEFTQELYRESSDPQGKSLDELETILRRMLLLKDQDAQRVFIELGPPRYFNKKDALEIGEEMVERFVGMIVRLKKKLEAQEASSLEAKQLLLLQQGAITPEEYEVAKRKLLS
jgi:hypothetical protein